MNENLLIKYTEDLQEQAGFDLGLLGESFTGFNVVFKELFDISQIQGELVLRTTKISEGSIDVLNLVNVVLESSPFKDPKDLMDFLQVADSVLHQRASDFFHAFGNGHKTVNDFFAENQFDSAVISGVIAGLLVKYFPKMIEWTGKQKQQVTTHDAQSGTISENQARKLRNMIISGRYKRALSPLAESGISSIKISSLNVKESQIVISESELENYLPDDEKILPEYENGMEIKLTGEILALQSTRGEKIKFKALGIEPRFQLLTAFPADDKKTEDYKEFYKKRVNITAEVFRKTLYKRPEIIIKKIELTQPGLFSEGVDQ